MRQVSTGMPRATSSRQAISRDGVRAPDSHRLTTAGETFTSEQSLSLVQPFSSRQTRSLSDADTRDFLMRALLPIGNTLSIGNLQWPR